MFSRGRKLIVPPQLEPVAIRLTKTELRPGTADNDVNAILSTAGGLPEGYMVMDFLTSNYAWFLLTNIAGLAMMNRIPYESDMQVDFVTDNLARERRISDTQFRIFSTWRSPSSRLLPDVRKV